MAHDVNWSLWMWRVDNVLMAQRNHSINLVHDGFYGADMSLSVIVGSVIDNFIPVTGQDIDASSEQKDIFTWVMEANHTGFYQNLVLVYGLYREARSIRLVSRIQLYAVVVRTHICASMFFFETSRGSFS